MSEACIKLMSLIGEDILFKNKRAIITEKVRLLQVFSIIRLMRKGVVNDY